MIGIKINDEERTRQMKETLKDYNINPSTADSCQKEMADCVAQKTKEALSNAGKGRTIYAYFKR